MASLTGLLFSIFLVGKSSWSQTGTCERVISFIINAFICFITPVFNSQSNTCLSESSLNFIPHSLSCKLNPPGAWVSLG